MALGVDIMNLKEKFRKLIHMRKLKSFIKKFMKYIQYGFELRQFFIMKNTTLQFLEKLNEIDPNWEYLELWRSRLKFEIKMIEVYSNALASISFSEYEVRHFMIYPNTR
jgi:hypothetical protein